MKVQAKVSTEIKQERGASKRLPAQAVVIGGSIAGLAAAKVLAEHFAKVIVIDRDSIPEAPEYRRGAPQAHHAHTLLPRGQRLLDQLFPGLTDELLEQGAVTIDSNKETAFFKDGEWHTPRPTTKTISSSRPLMEHLLYQVVSAHPAVEIWHGVEATSLKTDRLNRKVSGVRVRSRTAARRHEKLVPADLVIDASGRSSRAVQWLQSLGFPAPGTTTVDASSGYASRIYRRPENAGSSWKSLYVRPSAPDASRGGVILPLEDDRWHVSLFGMAGDYPPTDEEGFLEFARSLATPKLYEAIRDAEPISGVYGFRRTASRLFHYEALPAYLEGFLVSGDAYLAPNPVYAAGITGALQASQTLSESLKRIVRQGRRVDLTGLAADYYRHLHQDLGWMWKLVTEEDQMWSETEVATSPMSPAPKGREMAYPRLTHRLPLAA
jgi:flavin-dependent dehydrogenase